MGDKATVIVQGICGETTQDMRLRFPRDVLMPHPHVVIILGGTNDLSVGIPVAEILKNLHFFYEHVQLKEMLPVAVTVPSVCEKGWETAGTRERAFRGGLHPVLQQAIELRVELNESIKELSKEKRFPVVDWFSATCDPKTQTLAPEYSNDGLHLTTAGYRKLAEMIWDQVFEARLQ